MGEAICHAGTEVWGVWEGLLGRPATALRAGVRGISESPIWVGMFEDLCGLWADSRRSRCGGGDGSEVRGGTIDDRRGYCG